jgi:hypothetical protein
MGKIDSNGIRRLNHLKTRLFLGGKFRCARSVAKIKALSISAAAMDAG